MQHKHTLVKGPADWSECQATILLPEGTWQAEWDDKEEANHRHTIFTDSNGPGRIVFCRLCSAGNAPGWLSLQDLFLEFRDKHELGRWTTKTKAGHDVDCVAFVLTLDDRRVFAVGCAVKHGMATYAVVAWGFKEGLSTSRRVAETVIGSLRLETGD